MMETMETNEVLDVLRDVERNLQGIQILMEGLCEAGPSIDDAVYVAENVIGSQKDRIAAIVNVNEKVSQSLTKF